MSVATQNELLDLITAQLKSAHGDRLRGVVLYGSESRGQARPDSDIDVMVLLAEPIHLGRDLEKSLAALYPLAVRFGRRISVKPVSEREYEQAGCPLYDRVHLEGIRA